jgi:hypothetical protein
MYYRAHLKTETHALPTEAPSTARPTNTDSSVVLSPLVDFATYSCSIYSIKFMLHSVNLIDGVVAILS